MSKYAHLTQLYVEKVLKKEITLADVPLFLRKSVEEELAKVRTED